jgi:hypothetical protein
MAAALALVVAGCSRLDPYEGLTPAELAYVIPDSARWGPGNPCAEVGCGGAVESRYLRRASWVVFDAVSVVAGSVGAKGEGSIRIELDVVEVLRGSVDTASVEVDAWEPDIERVLQALDAGHELWAAVQCRGLGGNVCYIVAIDDEGRFAGIGDGAGLLFTAPLAREAADARAPSGRQFLEAVLAD